MEEMKEVNIERKERIKKGQPVYGPVQFTSRTYFAHVFDKMTYELKILLSATSLKIEDSEIEIMNKNFNQSPGKIEGFLQMQHVDRKYGSYIDELENSAKVVVNSEVLDKIRIE